MAEVEISPKTAQPKPERDLLAEAVALAAEPLPADPGPADKLDALAYRLNVLPVDEKEGLISLRAGGDRYYSLVDLLDAFLDRIEFAEVPE